MKVYLDNAATTKVDPRVLKVMLPYFSVNYGNASSIHTMGQENFNVLTDCREKVAKILGADSRGIIFTSSATEANNYLIKGIARANRKKGDHVIISAIEHPCVRESARQLEKEGFRVSIVPVNYEGLVEISELEKLIDKKTVLVSVMMVNNEIGTIQNISELVKLAKKYGTYFHTDAVQAVPYLKIDIKELGVDALSLSAHKFGGPKGVGLAYLNPAVYAEPLIIGGGQEEGKRAGTYNLPGIVGMTSALEIAYKERSEYVKRVKKLRDRLWDGLKKNLPDIQVNGSIKERVPANLNVMFGYVEGEAILIDLSYKGIFVSTGSACSATNLKASSVLAAIGLSKHFLNSNIRFSLGKETTEKEIDYTIKMVTETVGRLREFSPVSKL
ncbi:MAG: cysteine desulfurase family protein [Candidatus Falkowbacteria bacterium]|nr:cysteine desulfurase family protein [Candidatus Falkowbacteria bacterium]